MKSVVLTLLHGCFPQTKPAGDLAGELEQTSLDASAAHKAFRGKILEGGADVARAGYSQRPEFVVVSGAEPLILAIR